mgnify:FL=1
MDFAIFFVGLFCLLFRKYSYAIAIIIFLASTYFQLPLDPKYQNFLFAHNTSDLGILLYICFFATIALKYGVTFSHPIIKYVHYFYVFLACSALYDIFSGVAILDVITYLKNWIFLSVVYISPYINDLYKTKGFRIIYNLCLLCCLLILIQRFSGIEFFSMRVLEGRGIKPPSYSIYCAALCLINVWNDNKLRRCIHLIIFILPVILNLKMTYAVSIFAIYIVYLMSSSLISKMKRVVIGGVFLLSAMVVLVVNDSFQERFFSTASEINTISNDEVSGNFSYRLLHSYERCIYILKEPITFIRGIGFISEENFNKSIFELGVWNSKKDDVAQLDTGDIAWSIFFVRLGFIGLFFYLLMYFKLMNSFKPYMNVSKWASYFFSVMLIFICFTSFGNTIITTGDFFILPFLFSRMQKVG